MSSQDNMVASVSNLDVIQGQETILHNVNFNIRKGEFVYLVGKTGSGKSSLLRILYVDLPFQQGHVQLANYKLERIARKEIPFLRRKVSVVFQDFQLLYDRTVMENLLFVLEATGWKKRPQIRKRISEVLWQVGLASAENKMPHQLSGGEQQRVCIARALLNEPLLLLADEPTGNLDPEVAEEILQVFVEIHHSGTAVLMATHNYAFLQKYPFRVMECRDGLLSDLGILQNS